MDEYFHLLLELLSQELHFRPGLQVLNFSRLWEKLDTAK